MTSFSKGLQAVIFDMDGVIVDSEPLHERAFLEIFSELGLRDNHGVHFPDFYGKSDVALWKDFLTRHKPAQSFEELVAWKQGRFIEILREVGPIFESLPELVAKLAPKYRLAVASGSLHPVIDEVLALKNLRQYFNAVASVQDVSKGKPAPDVFLHAANRLGVLPENCCVIEDAAAGVEGALAAGMRVIAITNSLPRAKLAHATVVVDNYQEIEKLLLP